LHRGVVQEAAHAGPAADQHGGRGFRDRRTARTPGVAEKAGAFGVVEG
jgi:hypothetical protein